MELPTIIVIPCYNEATRLQIAIFKAFACTQPAVRFLFVDDGSTDGTWQVLAGLHQADPARFAIYRLPENCGKAEAVRQGMLRAFEAHPTYAGYWDADLATPLETIPRFIQVLDATPEIELVCGARIPLLGHRITRRAMRQWLGRLFAHAAALMLGVRIHDTQCGAKLFRATPQVHALFEAPFCTRWLLDVELVARMIQGRRGTPLPPVEEAIYEYALDVWRDMPGSKVTAWDVVKDLCGLARICGHSLR
jgi:glycosyltransferase involved in cell wall biosynthesis